MPRFLVVAHQTAASAELATHIGRLVKADPTTRFVLLVPATPKQHLLTWEEHETHEIARRAAETGRIRLLREGAESVEVRIGDGSPLLAVSDELRRISDYDGIVVCTLPLGASRWLSLDLPTRIERAFNLPVTHVVARRPVEVAV